MTTADIDLLRSRCTEAFSVYEARFKAVLAKCRRGELPGEEELRAEEQALYEYARVRRELLDALEVSPPEGR